MTGKIVPLTVKNGADWGMVQVMALFETIPSRYVFFLLFDPYPHLSPVNSPCTTGKGTTEVLVTRCPCVQASDGKRLRVVTERPGTMSEAVPWRGGEGYVDSVRKINSMNGPSRNLNIRNIDVSSFPSRKSGVSYMNHFVDVPFIDRYWM